MKGCDLYHNVCTKIMLLIQKSNSISQTYKNRSPETFINYYFIALVNIFLSLPSLVHSAIPLLITPFCAVIKILYLAQQ